MRKNKGKIISIIVIILSIITIGLNSYAHSGRTDAYGGHKDNKNKSGLGSYHYHCGGHPAHLHKNGVCPYSSNKSTTSSNKNSSSKSNNSQTSSSSKSSSSSANKETTKVPSIIEATGVKINEKVDNFEVGKSKTLTTTITPSNVTNKTITWKSSNESIATVSKNGEVTAKNVGSVDIIATTSNGKTDTVRINIKEQPKKENVVTVQAVAMDNTTKNSGSNDIIAKNDTNETNPVGTVVALGILGGGGYWVYKNSKKKK